MVVLSSGNAQHPGDADDDQSSISSVTTSLANLLGTGRASEIAGGKDDWANRAHIGHGISLQGLVNGEGHLPFSTRSVATSAEPISVERAPIADIVVSSTTSSAGAALMQLGLSKSAVTSAIPWLAILGEGEPDKGLDGIYVVHRQVYGQITVKVEFEDLDPNPEFVREVEQVLSQPHSDSDAQSQTFKRLLHRWGSLIATRVRFGCALISSTVFLVGDDLPGFGAVEDVQSARVLHATEKALRNALHILNAHTGPSAKQAELEGYADIARQLSFKVSGGTPQMQTEQRVDQEIFAIPDVWTIVDVDGVRPVFELLQHTRIDLYRKVIELVNTLYTPVPAPAPRKPEPTPAPRKPEPTPPYFVLSGKLTFWKHHNSHHEHINGWFETPLDDFDPAADFTVLGWIRSQVQPCTAIAINIQCAELGQSLLAIGEWDRNGLLQVVRAWHKGPNPVWFRDSAKSRIQVQKWQHVAFTQTYGKMCYYLDGKLVASSDVVGVAHTPVSKVKLCLGHGNFNQKRVDQWDGEIEAVKLWTRALSPDEVAAQAKR